MRRAWARLAVAGFVLYVAVDVALVFLRPQFSVLHSAESDYGSAGSYAWLMDANFLLRCLLTLAAVRALALAVPARLRAPLGLLCVWAAASGLLAFFPDDPVGTAVTSAGRTHLALAVVAFAAVALGTRLATRLLRREPGWQPVLAPLALLSWGAIVPVLLLGHSHLRPHSLGGLYEKIFLAMELGWIVVAAGWAARSTRPEPEARNAPGRAPTRAPA